MADTIPDNVSRLVGNDSDEFSLKNASEEINCRKDVPHSYELFLEQATLGFGIIALLWACVVLILAIFIEEVTFITRKFQIAFRQQKTVYLLGLMPVYALCAIIGLMVPRAGILVDLVSNSYFGFAMYSWMSLIGHYLGPENRAQAKGVTVLNLATFPCCCCCLCLPKPTFSQKTYFRLLVMVYQVTVIRPLLAFIAAVLWADDQYVPGQIGNTSFTYITCLNSLSTMFAIWGLIIVQKSFRDVLSQFCIVPKFLVLQLTLIGLGLGNVISATLVSQNVIRCTKFLPSRARAVRIDNSFVVIWMLCLSILGRFAFRRKQDGILDSSANPEDIVLHNHPTFDNIKLGMIIQDDLDTGEKSLPADLNQNL